MKEITIHCTWKSDHLVEVPDDFVVTSNLHDWPEEVLEQLTPLAAELVDWS